MAIRAGNKVQFQNKEGERVCEIKRAPRMDGNSRPKSSEKRESSVCADNGGLIAKEDEVMRREGGEGRREGADRSEKTRDQGELREIREVRKRREIRGTGESG